MLITSIHKAKTRIVRSLYELYSDTSGMMKPWATGRERCPLLGIAHRPDGCAYCRYSMIMRSCSKSTIRIWAHCLQTSCALISLHRSKQLNASNLSNYSHRSDKKYTQYLKEQWTLHRSLPTSLALIRANAKQTHGWTAPYNAIWDPISITIVAGVRVMRGGKTAKRRISEENEPHGAFVWSY